MDPFARTYLEESNTTLDNLTTSAKEELFIGFLEERYDGVNPEDIVFLMTLPNPETAMAAKASVPSSSTISPIMGTIGYCYQFPADASDSCSVSGQSNFVSPSTMYEAKEEANFDGIDTKAVYVSDTELADGVLSVKGFFSIPTNPDGSATISTILAISSLQNADLNLPSFPCYDTPAPKIICVSEPGQTTVPNDLNGIATNTTQDPNPGPLVDKFLNPPKLDDLNYKIGEAKTATQEAFEKVDMTKIFKDLFDVLWYSQLPCFDVRGKTSNIANERSMIKQCYWKGRRIECSAIFKTFPTDRGMCCTFNMAAADEMFKQSQYLDMVKQKQDEDSGDSFGNVSDSQWFLDDNEPKSKSGKNKGLTLVLDAHTDIVETGTISDDIRGFFVMVDDSGKYPMISDDSLLLPPGMTSYVSIVATDVTSDDGIRSIDPEKRNCYFSDEVDLNLHQNYTRSNCILECYLDYASEQTGRVCTPWFFPTLPNSESRPCDPWNTKKFRDLMSAVPDNQCNHCLPDCVNTVYQTSITSSHFRRCDNKNLGLSPLCQINRDDVINPPIWGESTLQDYLATWNKIPSYVSDIIKSNKRRYVSRSPVFAVQDIQDQTYDAYEMDIAVAHFFFKTPTVFQFGNAATMTWIDFISNIGGILGLFIGFSIVTCIELIYWFILRWIRYARQPYRVEPEEERDNLSSFTLASGVGPAFYKPPMSPRAIGLEVSDANY